MNKNELLRIVNQNKVKKRGGKAVKKQRLRLERLLLETRLEKVRRDLENLGDHDQNSTNVKFENKRTSSETIEDIRRDIDKIFNTIIRNYEEYKNFIAGSSSDTIGNQTIPLVTLK